MWKSSLRLFPVRQSGGGINNRKNGESQHNKSSVITSQWNILLAWLTQLYKFEIGGMKEKNGTRSIDKKGEKYLISLNLFSLVSCRSEYLNFLYIIWIREKTSPSSSLSADFFSADFGQSFKLDQFTWNASKKKSNIKKNRLRLIRWFELTANFPSKKLLGRYERNVDLINVNCDEYKRKGAEWRNWGEFLFALRELEEYD